MSYITLQSGIRLYLPRADANEAHLTKCKCERKKRVRVKLDTKLRDKRMGL
jgi:hypothetical protein